MISTADIKSLRDETNLSINECRKALEETKGDRNKALEVLRGRAIDVAAKKSDRSLGAGTIASYIHGGGVSGIILELSSETDFVARNDDFKTLARDIAMHVVAMKPTNVAELLTQPFIKAPEKTIGQLINQAVQKFGERIEVRRFASFYVSE